MNPEITPPAPVCPCCSRPYRRICKVGLRKQLLPALAFLAVQEQPMTTAEVADFFEDNPRMFSAIRRHFYQLVYWAFIQDTGEGRWKATYIARRFLDGLARVPKHVWVLNGQTVPPPQGKLRAELVSISDLTSEDFSDRRKHFEESVPAQLSICLSLFFL